MVTDKIRGCQIQLCIINAGISPQTDSPEAQKCIFLQTSQVIKKIRFGNLLKSNPIPNVKYYM